MWGRGLKQTPKGTIRTCPSVHKYDTQWAVPYLRKHSGLIFHRGSHHCGQTLCDTVVPGGQANNVPRQSLSHGAGYGRRSQGCAAKE